jgi:hypothetical protein
LGKVTDYLHLLIEGTDASIVDLVFQELKQCNTKLTLRQVDQYAMVTETLKDQSQVVLMLLGAYQGSSM